MVAAVAAVVAVVTAADMVAAPATATHLAAVTSIRGGKFAVSTEPLSFPPTSRITLRPWAGPQADCRKQLVSSGWLRYDHATTSFGFSPVSFFFDASFRVFLQ